MQRKCQMSGLQSPVVARGLERLSWWHTSNPGPAQCGHHSDESWSRLSHVELMDRWGESEELPITHPTKTQLITSALTLHTSIGTHRDIKPLGKIGGIRGEPVIREHFSSLISIACLMSKNTSGFCGQQPSLIILKRNTTPPQLELRTLFSAAVYVEQKKNGKRKRVKNKSCSFLISPTSCGRLQCPEV